MRIAKEDIPVKIGVPGATARQATDFGDATGYGKIGGEYFSLVSGIRSLCAEPIEVWRTNGYPAEHPFCVYGRRCFADGPVISNECESGAGENSMGFSPQLAVDIRHTNAAGFFIHAGQLFSNYSCFFGRGGND